MTRPVQARTRIGAALVPASSGAISANNTSSYRAVAGQKTTADNLGPLAELPGFWQGTGICIIARPDFSGNNENGIFLQLNALQETLEFTTIGSPVMNRGSVQDDIAIYGVTYLHRVTDAKTGGALHVEPGMWLNIPATTNPTADASIARLLTIPHGNAVCTVGFSQEVELQGGQPEIPPVSTVPFKIGTQPPAAGTKNPYPEFDLSVPTKFRTEPVPDEITQEILDDPMVAVRKALEGHTITKDTLLITNTEAGGGVCNIPSVVTNSDTPQLESLWAIEHLMGPNDTTFLQLQYHQVALLNFNGMSFPHVTVGTLIKAF